MQLIRSVKQGLCWEKWQQVWKINLKSFDGGGRWKGEKLPIPSTISVKSIRFIHIYRECKRLYRWNGICCCILIWFLILDTSCKAGYTNAVVKVRVLNNEVQYALICLYMRIWKGRIGQFYAQELNISQSNEEISNNTRQIEDRRNWGWLNLRNIYRARKCFRKGKQKWINLG